jgi:hypothetical protein
MAQWNNATLTASQPIDSNNLVGVGLNGIYPSLAIINDMKFVLNTLTDFLLCGLFNTYVANDGSYSSIILANIANLSFPIQWEDYQITEFGTDGEVYEIIINDLASNAWVVGAFSNAGITPSNYVQAVGYAMYTITNYVSPFAISTLTPPLPLGSIVHGMITSGTTPTNQLIYGGTSATSGAFAYSVVSLTGITTSLNLGGFPIDYSGGFNGLTYGTIPVSGSFNNYDILGLFAPSNIGYPMKFWCSNNLTTWFPLAFNTANNGDTPTTRATGQGLFFKNSRLYMNGDNNNTNNTYFKWYSTIPPLP